MVKLFRLTYLAKGGGRGGQKMGQNMAQNSYRSTVSTEI